MELFGRKLTSEHLKGFVEVHTKDGQVAMPKEWALELIKAYEEKQERDVIEQWLNDLSNPLEPLKVRAALESEIIKLNYRKEHDPESISDLDITIIAVLAKELGCYKAEEEE